MGKKEETKGQGTVSPISSKSKIKFIKGIGFFVFLVGAFIIADSVFSITGYATSISQLQRDKISILGLTLELIGVILMLIKIGEEKKTET